MRTFGATLPLLFASPSPDTVTTLTTPASVSSLRSAGQIIDNVRRLYRDLEDANISRRYTPSVKFSFVNAPSDTVTSSWRCHSQKDLSRYAHPSLDGDGNDGNNNNNNNIDKDDDECDIVVSSSLYKSIASTHSYTKPLALYLPGLDGMGISATDQFDDLAETFEFWRMTISKTDSTMSFADLVETVAEFVDDAAVRLDRDVVLIGESFGGLLAPAVAMRVRSKYGNSMRTSNHDGVGVGDGVVDDSTANTTTTTTTTTTMLATSKAKDPIKGLVLINPATSFDDTNWSILAPLLAQLKHLRDTTSSSDQETGANANERGRGLLPFRLPTPYSIVGGLTLASLIPDADQFRRIVSTLAGIPVTNPDQAADVLDGMVAGFGILDEELPADVIEHRVGRWLSVGSSVVNPRLSSLDVPTVVIAGRDDNLLPTRKEADRLVKVMPNCTKMEIRGSGHFVLDGRVNLTKAIIESHIDPLSLPDEPYDPILDWALPPENVVRATIENRVKPLRNLVSPVFFSTGPDGRRRLGLSHLPKADEGKPLLIVANHQFGGLDLGLIISQLIEERNIKARGLAHPVVFLSGNGNPFGDGNNDAAGGGANPTRPERVQDAGGDPFSPNLFQTFGAVVVSPRNYYRLMETGQCAMLFPGGVREVFHGKDEAYQLFWPEKVDFVRIAAKFNATIVPLSAVGAADSVNILIDAPDILKLPFGIGERAANNSANVMAARYDGDMQSELFQPPFALPKPLPARHYFVFGRPMSTEMLDHRDKEGCEVFYNEVKKEMMRGFDDVLRAREDDPWKDTARRIAYEQLTGKSAPTFPLSRLH